MLCLSFVYLIQTMVKLSFWFSEQGPFKVFSSAVYSDSEKKRSNISGPNWLLSFGTFSFG